MLMLAVVALSMHLVQASCHDEALLWCLKKCKIVPTNTVGQYLVRTITENMACISFILYSIHRNTVLYIVLSHECM